MSRHSRTRRTLTKFSRSRFSYWRWLSLWSLPWPPLLSSSHFQSLSVPLNSLFSSSNLACAWSACACLSSGRSRTSCTLRAEAITITSSSAPRCCASRIMRPTRGSSGRRESVWPMRREFVVVVHRAQLGEQLVAVDDGALLRRLDEGEVFHRAQAQRLHAQDHARQRAAQNFRVGEPRAGVEAGLVVEADADAVGHAAAAPGALVGRGLADRLHHQLLHLLAEAVALHARGAHVDHVADARHRERGFGHVGRQHDAPPAVLLKDAVLLGLRQPREQRQHLGVAQRGDVAQVLAQVVGGFADLALTGQKHQDVAALGPRHSSSTASAMALLRS